VTEPRATSETPSDECGLDRYTKLKIAVESGQLAENAPESNLWLQIHRILTPHFFDVQVLGTDGKPASGAYAYLTQTNRAGIAGQHGATHTNSEGRGSPSGVK